METGIEPTAQQQQQQPASANAAARSQLFETYDQFLTLLTTQLQNQDPLSPMETTEFTNQLVLFSQVEQQIRINEQLEEALVGQANQLIQGALAFIGLDAEVNADTFPYAGEPVRLSYTLAEQAGSTEVRIFNEAGTEIRRLTGETAAGRHEIVWDGLRADGTAADPGTYRVEVVATTPGTQDRLVEASTTVFGTITGVDSSSGVIALTMGDTAVTMDEVISVTRPGP